MNGGRLDTSNSGLLGEARHPDSIRLRDLEFTDLYMSFTGEVLIRGIEDSDGPLVEMPPEAIDDLSLLQPKIMKEGEHKNEFYVDWDEIRYRVSRIRGQNGDWFTLRKSKLRIPRMKDLGGFPMPVLRHLAWLGRHHGLIVISGATGHGKTTTACSLLQEYLISFGDVAVTIEDPPEMMLEGNHGNFGRCFQLRLEEDEDFGSALRRTMRFTPRYIFMGELRKSHDASQALRAAISGHLVITTIHAGSVPETLHSLLKLTSGTDSVDFARQQLADGLAGVIHQTLVREKGERPRLSLRYLFPGMDEGIRQTIRDGLIPQLSTAIEQQQTRVLQGKPPIELSPKRRG